MWVCDKKSNQNGTSTFLLQLEVIAPKRAPSRMCFFDLYFEVSWRPKDHLFRKETRQARPQANDRRHKEPRGRVFSKKVTEVKVLQVSKNGLMKKRLLSFSISFRRRSRVLEGLLSVCKYGVQIFPYRFVNCD